MEPGPDRIYAGFWLRTWAFVIDSVLLLMVILPALWLAYGAGYFREYLAFYGQLLAGDLAAPEPASRGLLESLMTLVFPAAAFIIFWKYRSATPGKMVVGARIVDAKTGGQPSIAQLVGRYLGYFVSTIPLGLGLIWVGIDARKQGWHDKLAGTVVVRDRKA